MTAPQISPALTWDDLASRWDTSGADWNRPVAYRLVEFAAIRPGSAVLDVGCGAGAVTFAAARETGPDGMVIGVDSSQEMVRRARVEATAAGIGNVVFAQHDAARLPYGENTFGTILASMLVRYLLVPERILRGWRHMLREGGTIGFSWVMREDPAWLPVLAAVERFLPPDQDGWASRKLWTVPEAEALLPRDMTVRTITEPCTTRYQSAEHFWTSSWTQAPARAWSQIPEPQRDDAQAAAFAMLAGLAGRDGSLERTRTVCYTTARLTSSDGG